MRTILVKITAAEDYDDVHPDLILRDAQVTPSGFEFEIVDSPNDSPVRKETLTTQDSPKDAL